MKHLGLDFDVKVRSVNENYPTELDIDEVASYLSKQKLDAFENDFSDESLLVITADTIVVLNDEILGKPASRHDAIITLEKLSGKKHKVITGVSMKSKAREVSFTVSTDVFFKELHKDEINYYVDHYEPYDKAGAYGIQEWIGHIGIEKIEGSFYNVMGLPVSRLYEELMKF